MPEMTATPKPAAESSKLVRFLKIVACICTLGFAFPDALGGDDKHIRPK